MRIGHWPPRQIARWWLRGLAAEVALVVIPLAIGFFVPDKPLSPEQQRLQEFMARSDSQSRGLLPPDPPLSDSQRAALKAYFRDSLGFDIVKRGDTTAVVALTPRAQALSDTLGRGITAFTTGLGEAIAIALMILAAIYLPIPIALLTLTTVWLWQRRGSGIKSG